jgi:sarcosine oxidase/L-pipecolate oxidase
LQYVRNQLERVPDKFTPLWKWRIAEEGKKCNGLEEGEAGPREMSKSKLAKRKDIPSVFQYLETLLIRRNSSRL